MNNNVSKEEETPCSLFERMREGMEENHNSRRSLRDGVKAKKAFDWAKFTPDVLLWQAQFDALVQAGRDDITIGYWRISTILQAEGEGADAQQRAIVAWAVANTERGVDMWIFDVDSGKEESRVGFDFGRHLAQSGKVKNIVAYRYDRFARNQYFAELIHREFRETDTVLSSATENLPKGFLGDLMRQILQAFAQYESAVIVARMSAGKREAVRRKGIYQGGEVPYGYLALGTRGDSGKGVLEVCESEAEVVRLIFLLYSMGYSQSAIANYLNRMNVPTRWQKRFGWQQGQIRRIIKHEPAYRSEALFSRAVIESETIAHSPIMPHRENIEERTYLFGNVTTQAHGTQVPDDFTNHQPLPKGPKMRTIHSFTPEQARVIMFLYRLRDEGKSQRAIAECLNEHNLSTLEGKAWKQQTVHLYLKSRTLYEDKIAEMEIGGVIAPIADTSPAVDMAAAVEREKKAIIRIHELRADALSIRGIVVTLAEEGFITRLGNKWHANGVNRVLQGHKRLTETISER